LIEIITPMIKHLLVFVLLISVFTTAKSQTDTLNKSPAADTTVKHPVIDTLVKHPATDSLIQHKFVDTLPRRMPVDSAAKHLPADTLVKHTVVDSLVKHPAGDTVVQNPPVIKPPADSVSNHSPVNATVKHPAVSNSVKHAAVESALKSQPVVVIIKHSPIKTLSDKKYNAWLNGDDLDSMAMVGEMNHYPLPDKALKYKVQIGLNPGQITKLKNLAAELHRKKVEMGNNIIRNEKMLDSLFHSKQVIDGTLIFYTNRSGLYLGELRGAILMTCYQTEKILSDDQIRKLEALEKTN